MERWLKCKVSPGQFEGEYGVDGTQFNGVPFSLFAPQDAIRFETVPAKEQGSVDGLIRVQVVQESGDLILVSLPRSTFQNGPFVTVKPEQLQEGLANGGKGSKARNGRR